MSTTLVAGLALISRILFLSTVPIFEYMLPHIPTDQFWAPVWLKYQDSVGLAAKMFFGLGNWDSQHFLHIAFSGYTFQTDLPFFPLFPILVRNVANVLQFVGLNPLSSLIFSATALNIAFFVWSAIALYQLTVKVFDDEEFAMRSVALYCISPATIFFMAFYSESLFALATFKGLLCHHSSQRVKSALWFAAACMTRANGIVNAGFIMHYFASQAVTYSLQHFGRGPIFRNMMKTYEFIVTSFILSFTVVLPFGMFQYYTHNLLCFSHRSKIAVEIRQFSVANDIPLVADPSDYCGFVKHQLPYSWVQEKFWNVGFLKYWTFNQIPNFLLALPAIIIITKFSVEFISRNRRLLLTPHAVYDSTLQTADNIPPVILVYVVHALFLVTSSLFVINVQVTTRLIASSTPLLYWIAARHMVTNENVPIPVGLIFDFFTINRSNIIFSGLLIYLYFITYAMLGLILFTNGFPWT